MVHKISSRKEMIEALKDLLALEKEAKESYDEDLNTFKNFEIKDTLLAIEKDEERHIAMVEGLISMLKKD